MALPTPPSPNQPIPNNPFYYLESWYVQGPYNPLIVGSGLSVSDDGYISSTGGGGGVASIIAGAGISVSGPTGNVTITNNGVQTLTGGPGITVTGTAQNPVISSSATGTVTQINTGTGLTGGPITNTGTISILPTTVSAGSYTLASFTVNAQGQITAASNGTAVISVSGTSPIVVSGGLTPTISVNASSTTQPGVVQLSDSLTSTSITTAATSNAVKAAYDVATAAIPKSCITGLGSLITGTGASTPVALPAGANGQILYANSASATGLCWSNPPANTAIPCACITGKGALVTGTAANTPIDLSVGADGQVLYACSAAGTGLCWASLPANTAIPCSCITAKGTLISGTAANTPTALAVGVNGQVLYANSASATGLCWGNLPSVPAATPTVAGIVLGCTTGFFSGATAALGTDALSSLTTGTENVAVGPFAALSTTTGALNVAIGSSALYSAISETENVAVGAAAGSLAGGSGITALGAYAGQSSGSSFNGGDCNTFVGYSAGSQHESGCFNVFIGACSNTTIGGSTGCNNVVIGPNVCLLTSAASCQLLLGYANGCHWLTGCSNKNIQPGAGILDCSSSAGTANWVLTSQGNAVEWKPVGSSVAAPNYGSFYSTVSQTISTPGTPQAVTLNNTAYSNNFSVVASSRMTAAVAGTYNLQFSIQLLANPGGGGDVEIWLSKNGTAVPNSNTRFHLKNTNEAEFAALNYVEQLAASDYLELIWSTADSDNVLFAATSPTALGGPAIPSAIVTIVPVGA